MATTGGSSGWWRTLLNDRPGALEVLLGEEHFASVMPLALAFWIGAVAVSVIGGVLLAAGHLHGVRLGWALGIAIGGLVMGLVTAALREHVTVHIVDTFTAIATVGLFAELWLIGPRLGIEASATATGVVVAALFLPRRAFYLAALGFLLAVGALLFHQQHDGLAASRAVLFVGAILGTSGVLVWVSTLIERLAAEERQAREDLAVAHAELAELNAQLAEVVDEQSVEIGGLQRLRQFLAPQVADAVVALGLESLAPHRARIAVVFCDLRGFTAFSSSAEPEEVMEALDAYYALVGRTLQDRGATVGSFAGDGIMAYFGDPVPCDDPAGDAIGMALDLHAPLRGLVGRWRRRGFDLGCGIGIAFGFATIGPVGFEGRTDYTAVGPTVNLAARLCGSAADGEILVDGRAFEAVRDRVASEERLVELRGFARPITAQNITGWSIA